MTTDAREQQTEQQADQQTEQQTEQQTTAIQQAERSEQDQAMADAIRSGDNETVLRILSMSVALLPQDGSEDGEPQPEGTISLPMIEHEGNSYIAIFTSETALIAAGGDPESAISLPLAELAASWPSDELWMAVNPATEDGISLPPDVVNALPVYAMSAEQPEGRSTEAAGSDGQSGESEPAAQASADQGDGDNSERDRSDGGG
jgi:hypothetical protein